MCVLMCTLLLPTYHVCPRDIVCTSSVPSCVRPRLLQLCSLVNAYVCPHDIVCPRVFPRVCSRVLQLCSLVCSLKCACPRDIVCPSSVPSCVRPRLLQLCSLVNAYVCPHDIVCPRVFPRVLQLLCTLYSSCLPSRSYVPTCVFKLVTLACVGAGSQESEKVQYPCLEI